MFNKIGLVGLATASVAVAFLACGGEGGGDDITCTADTDCRVGEICHPDAKVCVQTCTSSDECPDASKTCAPLVAGDTSTQICKCTTSALCQGGPAGANSVCSEAYDVCVPSCTTDTDCSTGQTCDTATSTCVSGSTGCDGNEDCATGQTCNTTTGVCEGGGNTTCDSSQPQPAACSYGQFCSGTTCTAVPAPTCMNISQHGASWSATQATKGPVIYDIQKFSFGDDTGFCGMMAPRRVKVTVRAYRTEGTFPTDDMALRQELHYVRTDGSEGSAGGIQNLNVTNNGQNAQFDLNFCVASSLNMFTGALHFVNGNEFCFQVQ